MKSGGTPMTALRYGGVTWNVREAGRARLAAWLEAHFPAILDRKESLLKSDTGSRVAAADGLVLKEATPRKGRSAWRFGLRRSASRRVFRLAEELAGRGVRTPRPVAWATVRRFGLRVRGYLVTEQVQGCAALRDKLDACRQDRAERDRLMIALGRLAGSFHAAGLSNRDLKDTNILVTEAGGLALWAVDLDGARRAPVVTRRRAAKDFWPIIRSLTRHGFGDEADRRGLLEGYDAVVPGRLRLEAFPAVNGMAEAQGNKR